jgi:hypothetical protein
MYDCTQLAHIKHYDAEPLSVFAQSSLMGKSFENAFEEALSVDSPPGVGAKLVRHVQARLAERTTYRATSNSPRVHQRAKPLDTEQDFEALSNILHAVDEARRAFNSRARQLKIAFRIMMCVRQWMITHGYRSADPAASQTSSGRAGHAETVLQLLLRIVKGEVGRDIRWLGMMIKCVGFHGESLGITER